MTLSLITDRTLADVQRVIELAKIGWTDMTADEKGEWLNGSGGGEALSALDGAQDAYQLGDQVSHNEKHWLSIVDDNVWEPGVYGWEEQA